MDCFTYYFGDCFKRYLFIWQGLTAPLREIRDAAESLTQGDYTKRVSMALESNDEIGQLSRSFNVMADELEHADQMRRDLIANVSHELRTPVSALQALVENMADGVVETNSCKLRGHFKSNTAFKRFDCFPA